ncbi:MAG: hypothetical protein ACREDF_06870, partial [Thermoplasmata archaeon]
MMTRSAVDSLLRIEQAYCAQLCEKRILDYGIAYYSARFAGLPEVNQYREVIAETPSQLRAAHAECEAFFRSQDLCCCRWAPARGAADDEAARFLADLGYRSHREVALSFTQWVAPTRVSGVRILPARAMRGAFRGTFSSLEPRAEQSPAPDSWGEAREDPDTLDEASMPRDSDSSVRSGASVRAHSRAAD